MSLSQLDLSLSPSSSSSLHLSGTDATHAEHIETIKSRNYVGIQSDGSFVPGELGMGLVEGTCNITLHVLQCTCM